MNDSWTETIVIISTILGVLVFAYVFITDEMGGHDGGGY